MLVDWSNPVDLAAFVAACLLAVWLLLPGKNSW